MSLHELFGEGLGAFQLCTFGRRTDNRYSGQVFGKMIDHTEHQRVFGSYDDEVHLVFPAEIHLGIEIANGDGHILSAFSSAGITGGDVEVFTQRRLGDLPGHGMFSSSGSKQQNVHV